jgi:hypothetical protein
MLLKESSQKSAARKTFFSKTSIANSTDREIKSFELVQVAFKNSQFLTHFNIIRQFLLDVNAFKKEFEAFAYHIKKEREHMIKLTAIELIVFLSKILTSIEKRY